MPTHRLVPSCTPNTVSVMNDWISLFLWVLWILSSGTFFTGLGWNVSVPALTLRVICNMCSFNSCCRMFTIIHFHWITFGLVLKEIFSRFSIRLTPTEPAAHAVLEIWKLQPVMAQFRWCHLVLCGLRKCHSPFKKYFIICNLSDWFLRW